MSTVTTIVKRWSQNTAQFFAQLKIMSMSEKIQINTMSCGLKYTDHETCPVFTTEDTMKNRLNAHESERKDELTYE